MKRGHRARGIERLRLALAALMLLGTLHAAVRNSSAQTESKPSITPDPKLSEAGLIEVQITQARRQNCWSLILRGNLANPYDQTVEGVRLIVRLRQSGEAEPKTVERFEVAISATVEPRRSTSFSRTLNIGCTTTFNEVSAVAFAAKRAGAELVAADLALEDAAAAFREAASPGSGVARVSGASAVSVY